MTELGRVANFDALARVYSAVEQLSFGGALQRRRGRFLGELSSPNPKTALVLGDGDGRFSAELLSRYPTLEVTALDASSAMLCALETRVRREVPHASLTLCHTDIRTWRPEPARYDLVATHFFFDCFSTPEVAGIVARITPLLAPNATWLFSDFSIPARGIRRALARCLVRALYFAQSLLTGSKIQHLPDHARALSQAGFSLVASESALGGVLRSERWQYTPPTS